MNHRSEAISLWDKSAKEPVYSKPIESTTRFDTAIVGGGFTGLSTALHLAERGLNCCVLEARTIGYGGSGRNAGLVNAGLWLPPQDIRTTLGDSKGSHLVETLSQAPEYVFNLIEKHQIRCELQRNGTIHAAHSAAGFADISRRAEEWYRLGAAVDLLDKNEVASKTGSGAFYGGLLDHRAGTINPMGYVRGLARAATSAGARVYTGVRVKKLHYSGDKWQLTTDSAPVIADTVVLGTNAYTDDLWPDLKHCFTMIHYFQVATEPLGDRARHILPQGQGLWDTGRIMFSLRRDACGRIIVGSMGKIIGGEHGLTRRWAARSLRRLFPGLGQVGWDIAWHGQIAMTPDHIPRIYRLAPGLYTPIGYNGRGIAPGTIFGKAMAELLSGNDKRCLPLPITDFRTVRSAALMSRVYETVFKANQFVKSF